MSYENRKTKFNLYVFLFLKQVVKKTKGSSKKVLKDITTSEDEEMTKTNTKKVESNDQHPVIPDAIRFDPSKSLENKPKGLVDSLTKYFTPGVKRTSRTALSTLIKPQSELETATPVNKKRKQLFTSSGEEEGE